MSQSEVLALISLFLGILARVFIPFLQARRQDPTLSWNWQYVWPQALGVLIIVLGLPVLVPDLDNVLQLNWQAAWLVGVGAAESGNIVVGREVRARWVR